MKGLIFTYGLTYGGAFVSLFNPFIGLLIYVSFSIIRPEAMWHWSVPPGNYSRIIAIALLFGWMLHGLGRWDFGRARFTVYAFSGYMFWAVVSGMQADNQNAAWGFIELLAKIFIPFLVGITLIDSVDKLKQLAWVIVLSQGYVAFELNMSYLSQGGMFLHYFRHNGFGGMDNNCVSIAMAAGAGFAFFLGMTSNRWWQKGIAFGCTLLMVHVILFAFSRGGMLALIFSGVVAFILLPKRPMYFLAYALIIVLGLRLAGPEVQQRFMTVFVDAEERDESAQSRLDMWEDCVDVMKKNPIFGVGPDHWPLIAPQYGWPHGKEAHSLWLQIGAELGVVGLLLLLTYYLSCIARLWPLTRTTTDVADPWLRGAARMVILGLVGFMLSAQFVSLEGLELPYYIAMFGAGAQKVNSLMQNSDWDESTLQSGHFPFPWQRELYCNGTLDAQIHRKVNGSP